jgi:hypothetical protein
MLYTGSKNTIQSAAANGERDFEHLKPHGLTGMFLVYTEAKARLRLEVRQRRLLSGLLGFAPSVITASLVMSSYCKNGEFDICRGVA